VGFAREGDQTTMQRRKFIAGLGSLAAAGAAVTGTSAFTSVEADRGVNVEVAADDEAFLGLEPLNNPNSNQYVELNGGTLDISIDQSGNDGDGVNLNALTKFDRMFEVTNQGTQAIALYILYDPADAQSGFMPGPNDSGRLDPSDPDLGLAFYRENGGLELNHPEGHDPIDRSTLFNPGESVTLGVSVDTRGFSADTTQALFDGQVTVTALGLGTQSI
jgi:hypothetical protein